MESRITTWESAVKLAEKTGLTTEQTKAVLQAQAELAYEHVDNGYPIAGIGFLYKTENPARTMELMFGPQKGRKITIPAKKVLKFRIAKAAKDVVLRRQPSAPDVTKIDVSADDGPKEETD